MSTSNINLSVSHASGNVHTSLICNHMSTYIPFSKHALCVSASMCPQLVHTCTHILIASSNSHDSNDAKFHATIFGEVLCNMYYNVPDNNGCRLAAVLWLKQLFHATIFGEVLCNMYYNVPDNNGCRLAAVLWLKQLCLAHNMASIYTAGSDI